MAEFSMVSLELQMWRPTPQKPDISGSNPSDPENRTDFTSMESFNAMFHIDPSLNGRGKQIKRAGGSDCAFAACLSANGTNGGLNALATKVMIKTNTMTAAAISTKLTLWRPTPQKPDIRAGSATKSYQAYFVLESAKDASPLKASLEDGVLVDLAQRDASETERTLEIIFTIPSKTNTAQDI